MRVLFSAHGAFGHVLPMVGMARALTDLGHEVRFATGQALCPAASALGLKAIPAGMSDDTLVAEAHRRWPETKTEPPAGWAPRMFTDIAAPAMLAALAPIIDSWRPDLLIREEGEHAGPVAAAAAGVTWVTHGWGSPLPSHATVEEQTERVAPLWRAAGLPAPSADELYGAAVLDPCPSSLYGENGAPFPVTRVRATPLPARGDRAPRCLPSGRPLAYVGFGTVPLYRDHPELIEMVVTALLSHYYHILVTTGDARLTEKLIVLDPERVNAEQWVSLPELLASCELVVSHGGAGTVLAALAAGLPLLLLPRGAPSQTRMSHACATNGAARVLAPADVTPAHLEQSLAALTAEERYRTAARELAAEIAATPGPDHAAECLHTLASSSRREPPGVQ